MNKLFLIFSILLISFVSPPEFVHAAVNKSYERVSGQKNNEKIVYITKTGKKFHSQNCHHLKSCISINKSEAIQLGYAPCKVCKPN